MLSFIAKPFGILIKYIYEYLAVSKTGSYGFAIILFTLFCEDPFISFKFKTKEKYGQAAGSDA